MRYPTLSIEKKRTLATAAFLLLSIGCRQDMHDAPRFDPLERIDPAIHSDARSARDPIPGTIARGLLKEDTVLYTGKTADGKLAATAPMAVDRKFLLRGQERFNIYCSPCHDRVGTGNGMIVRRGFKQPQTFHSDRLREQPLGYFVDVMTNGFGQMSSYAHQVKPEDRWAIATYIKALQYSQNARVLELSAEDRQKLMAPAAAPAEGDAHGRSGEGH